MITINWLITINRDHAIMINNDCELTQLLCDYSIVLNSMIN